MYSRRVGYGSRQTTLYEPGTDTPGYPKYGPSHLRRMNFLWAYCLRALDSLTMDRFLAGWGAGSVVEVTTGKGQELAMKVVVKAGSSHVRIRCSGGPVQTSACDAKRSTWLIVLFRCWSLIEAGSVAGGIAVGCCHRRYRRRSCCR